MFVGSGLSVPLGYPSWKNLVRSIHQNVEATKSGTDDSDRQWIENSFASQPDWVAEAIEHGSREAYLASLRRIFDKKTTKNASFNHIFSVLLPFEKYLTTNYDSAIEQYAEAFIGPNLPVYSYADAITNYSEYANAGRSLLKLHGCAQKSSENLILTSSQYHSIMKDSRYIRLLSHIFSSTTILAIGFSLKDRDFRTFLEERHHLYQRRCPPFYAIIPADETCKLEIDVLFNKYNVTVLPISKENNFSELTRFLYSLYCLVYREDSSIGGTRIAALAAQRIRDKGLCEQAEQTERGESLSRAVELLACFQEPLDLTIFLSFLLENGIEISAAELLTSVTQDIQGRIYTQTRGACSTEDKMLAAKWIASELSSIPVANAKRHFTTYHKEVFHQYQKTICFVLSCKNGWREAIGEDAESPQRLIRFNQYFRQEGLWGRWLEIAEHALGFVDPSEPAYRPLLQSILWVYFWTRRFSDAEKLIMKHPELDDSSGEHNYSDRIKYMRTCNLEPLVRELESKDKIDYFAKSLLGRSYARLSLGAVSPEAHLSAAKKWLILAKSEAENEVDWIEKSIQSWYLAIVYADLGEVAAARQELAEVRRLDEAIMNRVPGIAWLRLAEYRLAVRDNSVSSFRTAELRSLAYQAFESLGTIDTDSFIDHEYFY